MKMPSLLLVLAVITVRAAAQARVGSPDRRNEVQVAVHDGRLSYSVRRDGKPLITPSQLGFVFRGAPALRDSLTIVDSSRATFDETWTQPWGEVARVRNHYNELKVVVQETAAPRRHFTLAVQAFNDGVAFRYEVPAQPSLGDFEITDELTEFALADNARTWWIASNRPRLDRSEQLWSEGPVSTLDSVQTPLTMEFRGGKTFVVIHEANLVDYAKMNIRGPRLDNRTLHADLALMADGVKVRGRMTWSSGPKHGATTANTKRYIDFAAANGFGGVLVEGWNVGWDGDWIQNRNAFSFTQPYPDYDIVELARYAHSKGVHLIVHTETSGGIQNYERQMDSAFSMYEHLGLDAIKSGYVTDLTSEGHSHWSQFMVNHYRHVIEMAAQHHIMLDVHEPIHDTGERRTYPNMMSREGARGQEYNAWGGEGGNPPEHETILFFTRLLDGPMDFTPGIFDILRTKTGPARTNEDARVRTTLAKQLALYVVIYSPLQMAADLPENYEGQPALQFIKDVAVDWDTTRVIDGKIGDYVIVARKQRNSPQWFLGAITDEEARTFDVPLTFLDPGKSYIADIYADGPGADWLTNPLPVRITHHTVTRGSHLRVALAPGGGQAIRIRPAGAARAPRRTP